ncbi:hypothetical protein AB0J83_03460 [Actinoplanes sp. NPDC049596]|uniref:hypothetical protein n=1 Tax=unclassified Actinoplanes TaxID=2626549 RepID=UPI0034322348
MLLATAPTFSRVRITGLGSIDQLVRNAPVEVGEHVIPWTRRENVSGNPFATVQARGVLDGYRGLIRLPEDATVGIVDAPRYAGHPDDLIQQATAVSAPVGSDGAVATNEGWPELIWASDILFSPVQGWDDAGLSSVLCALTVAPDDDHTLSRCCWQGPLPCCDSRPRHLPAGPLSMECRDNRAAATARLPRRLTAGSTGRGFSRLPRQHYRLGHDPLRLHRRVFDQFLTEVAGPVRGVHPTAAHREGSRAKPGGPDAADAGTAAPIRPSSHHSTSTSTRLGSAASPCRSHSSTRPGTKYDRPTRPLLGR